LSWVNHHTDIRRQIGHRVRFTANCIIIAPKR
jgi:hypothetical protein